MTRASQKVELAACIHLALDELELGVLAFGPPLDHAEEMAAQTALLVVGDAVKWTPDLGPLVKV